MEFIDQIQKSWKSMAVIGGIIAASIFSWNYLMDQVALAAEKTVMTIINKEMVDGAKKAASDAVKEQLPSISKQVAKDVVDQLKKEQMIRPPPEKKTN